MIKNALKNFFKNFVYVFVPMGIVYLVLLIAFFALLGGTVKFAGTMLTELFSLIKTSSEQSSASLNEFFAFSADELTRAWNGNLWSFFRTIFETHWLQNTVIGFFRTLGESSEGFEEQTLEIVTLFRNQIVALVSGVASFCVAGIFAANFVTRFMVRRRTAKRGLKKFFIARTVVPVAQVLLLIASGVLFSFIRYYSLLVVIVFVFAMTAIAFVSSWIVHRDKSLKLRDVLTLKNILKHLAAIGLILLFNVALAVLLYLVNPLLAILIMIPVVLYSLNIADINTDAIVCKLIEEKRQLSAAPAFAEDREPEAPFLAWQTEETAAAADAAAEETEGTNGTNGTNGGAE